MVTCMLWTMIVFLLFVFFSIFGVNLKSRFTEIFKLNSTARRNVVTGSKACWSASYVFCWSRSFDTNIINYWQDSIDALRMQTESNMWWELLIAWSICCRNLKASYHMSYIMRKLVFAVCEQRRRRSACASRQSDERLCYSMPRYYNTSFFYIRNFKTLSNLCGCADWFESYLVENPEDKFSRDKAHIICV